MLYVRAIISHCLASACLVTCAQQFGNICAMCTNIIREHNICYTIYFCRRSCPQPIWDARRNRATRKQSSNLVCVCMCVCRLAQSSDRQQRISPTRAQTTRRVPANVVYAHRARVDTQHHLSTAHLTTCVWVCECVYLCAEMVHIMPSGLCMRKTVSPWFTFTRGQSARLSLTYSLTHKFAQRQAPAIACLRSRKITPHHRGARTAIM